MANLILCEKPDMARKIASGVDLFDKGSWKKNKVGMQYFQSNNYYIVSMRGHLIEYVDFEDYEGKMDWKSSISYLPFVPEKWKSRILTIKVKDKDTGKFKKITDPDAKKRIDLIKELVDLKDVDTVIVGTDPDDEGDFIAKRVIDILHISKPIYRILCKDLVKENIQKYIKEKIPEKERFPIYRKVEARSKSDWVLGINLTRFATVMANEQNGKAWNVGRVSTCIVKLIYDREKEIKNFKPVDYYKLVSNTKYNDIDVELKSEAEFDLDELNIAKRLCADFNSKLARVKKVEQKESISNPPKLFSQTTLQNVLSQKFGYTPDETLSYCQSMYEQALLSYP